MKKLLLGMAFFGLSASISAMNYSDAPQEISLCKGAIESSFRQKFKDYSYLDVAYAKIPEATIDMNDLDPLEKKPFKELKKGFDQYSLSSGLKLARVATDASVYYCGMQELAAFSKN